MQGYCWTMRELNVRLAGLFLRIRELQNGTTVHAYFNFVNEFFFLFQQNQLLQSLLNDANERKDQLERENR